MAATEGSSRPAGRGAHPAKQLTAPESGWPASCPHPGWPPLPAAVSNASAWFDVQFYVQGGVQARLPNLEIVEQLHQATGLIRGRHAAAHLQLRLLLRLIGPLLKSWAAMAPARVRSMLPSHSLQAHQPLADQGVSIRQGSRSAHSSALHQQRGSSLPLPILDKLARALLQQLPPMLCGRAAIGTRAVHTAAKAFQPGVAQVSGMSGPGATAACGW